MSVLLACLCLVPATALLAVAFRTSSVAIAAWLGLALLLRGSIALPLLPGITSAAVALYVAVAIGFRGVVPVPGAAFFAVAAGIAAGMVIPVAAARLLAPRQSAWTSTLVFPLACVTAEFLQARFGPYGTNGSIAYTQSGNLPLMQLAAITGIWGITFLVAWSASLLSWTWEQRFAWDVVGRGATTYAAVVALVLLAGSLRVSFGRSGTSTVRAAVVSFPSGVLGPGERTRVYEGRLSAREWDAVAPRLAALQQWFLDGSVREARSGARLVAWPEMNLIVLERDEPAFRERASRMARDEGIFLAIGMATVDSRRRPPTENKVVLIEPSGRIAFSYTKSRPVPGWEASITRRGDGRLPVVDTALGRIGAAICFENDFPEFVRRIGLARAGLWIAPANDWEAIKYSHFTVAAFRAIENGVAVLRPASSGVSGAFDRFGRVVAMTDHFTGGRTMVAEIALGNVPTFYARAGDWFAWLCVAGIGLVVAFRLMRLSG